MQGFGFVEHAAPAVQATQPPFPSQTDPAPQLVPAATLAAESRQTDAPVAQLDTPTLHDCGLVVQACPAAHATHVPPALHTRFEPQAVPAETLTLESAQTGVPEAHAMPPTRHGLGLEEHAVPAVQSTQVPAPSQTLFAPQAVPAPAFTRASTHVARPVAHEVIPPLHAFGFVVHAAPATQAVQAPSRQTRFEPHAVPLPTFCPVSVQVAESGVQVKVPRWQRSGG